MTTCRDCQREVSESAWGCPGCDAYQGVPKSVDSAGFVRIYGHMIHTDGQPTPLWQSGASTGIVERVIDMVVDKQFASVNNCPPRTVDRAGHPRPRHALSDCPTLFGTLLVLGVGGNSTPQRTTQCREGDILTSWPDSPKKVGSVFCLTSDSPDNPMIKTQHIRPECGRKSSACEMEE